MEADVADAVFVFFAFGVGLANPEARLAVRPTGGVLVMLHRFEAEKDQELAVECLRPREVADADDEVIDAEDAGHVTAPSRNNARGPARFGHALIARASASSSR